MGADEKVLTYEDAKQLCLRAFDAGALYGSESMRYGVNAVAYDWEHWLKENESLFKPEPTVEDVLREFADEVYADADNEIRDRDFLCAKYAKRLKLAGDAS